MLGRVGIHPGDVTGWGPADPQQSLIWTPDLCTADRYDLLMVVKLSSLNINEKSVFIKPWLLLMFNLFIWLHLVLVVACGI